MIAPKTVRGNCSECGRYEPLTEGFPDRDGTVLRFCSGCCGRHPTPQQIDAGLQRIRSNWDEIEHRARWSGVPRDLAREPTPVVLDQIYTVTTEGPARAD
jgi:hypothetical protein